MRYEDLAGFVECYNTQNRHEREATWDAESNHEGRWWSFTYEALVARGETSLDAFWLKNKNLTDLDNLLELDELAKKIIQDIEAGLNGFREGLAALTKNERTA